MGTFAEGAIIPSIVRTSQFDLKGVKHEKGNEHITRRLAVGMR